MSNNAEQSSDIPLITRPWGDKICTRQAKKNYRSYYTTDGTFVYVENMLHRHIDHSYANWLAEIMSTPCDIMKCSACESGWADEKPTLNCGYCRKLITGQEPIFRRF